MSKYVVLDLEMCKLSKEAQKDVFKSARELIQIGAVEMDEHYRITRSFQTFVKPEFGALDPFIEKLTGIKAENLENAPTADRALKEFYEWLDEDSIFVTWSDSDVIQIDDELYFKEIDLPGMYDYLDNYIDCQFLFGEKLHASKQYRLSEALAIANVDYDAAIHNALVDAFSPYYMTQDEASRCIFNSFATRCFA